jgi:hypothetical protein
VEPGQVFVRRRMRWNAHARVRDPQFPHISLSNRIAGRGVLDYDRGNVAGKGDLESWHRSGRKSRGVSASSNGNGIVHCGGGERRTDWHNARHRCRQKNGDAHT